MDDYQNQIKEIVKEALADYEKATEYQIEDIEKAVGNVYFLYSDGNLKYIGQREAEDIKARLKNHLLGTGAKTTGTKWDKVESELKQGKKITFKTILAKPDNLRSTIKLELLEHFQPEWNERSK